MISVIVPTYNRPHLLCDSLHSILSQSYDDIEVILIDGSDNNDSKLLVQDIYDPRIKYLKIQNTSAAHSRNIGLDMARGEFIAFNDDDDIWFPDKLMCQMQFIKSNQYCKICFGAFQKKKTVHNEVIPKKHKIKCDFLFKELLKTNFIGLPTILLKRSILNGKKFDEELTCLEDWEFILSLSRKYKIGHLNKILVEARNTSGSVNKSSYSRKASAYKKIYKKYYSDIHQTKHVEAKHLLSIGSNLYLSGSLQEGREYIMRAHRLRPTSLTLWGILLCTYLGRTNYQNIFKLFETVTGREP